MGIELPADAVQSALLGGADALWISASRALARALFGTRGHFVARELVATDRLRRFLTHANIGIAFGITAKPAHHRFARHVSPRT